MTIGEPKPSPSSLARRETRQSLDRHQPSLPEPSEPHLQRPLELTLLVLNDLADALARQGIKIRGAFSRLHMTRARPPRRALKKSTANGDDFVGHFSIPTTDNRGNPFPVSLLCSILSRLYEGMGGASFRETVGLWRDRGVCYVDLLIAVEVWTNDREKLVTLIEEARRELDQKCIPLRLERAEFVWITRPKKATL